LEKLSQKANFYRKKHFLAQKSIFQGRENISEALPSTTNDV